MVGDVRVTPVVSSMVGQWPRWGFVWTRPAALEVERNGQVERMPIVDITRLVQVGLLAVAVLGACGAMLRVASARTRAKAMARIRRAK